MDLEFSEIEESPPFKQRGFQTPVWPFRPRKFSSPFVSVPRLHFDDASDSLIQPREDASSALFDSGLGSTFADYEAEKGRLCPRYHNDGICDLGRNCPLTHEEKRPTERILTSSFDPNAPEFVPRPRRPPPPTWSTDDDNIMKSDAGTDDELARDLTKLALHMKKNFTPRAFHSNKTEETGQQNRFRSKGVKDSKSPRHRKDIKLADCTTPVAGSVFMVDESELEPDYSLSVHNDSKRTNVSSKFKTKPCTTFYTIGSCPYGNKCNFYHKEDEKNSFRVKTRLCKSWSSGGVCEYGERCDFAHGSEELVVKFKTRMCKIFQAIGKCPYGDQCTFAHFEREKRKDISTVYKFKTELCQLWLSNKCIYGPACHFAHGINEMNNFIDAYEE